jgi:hypothetical protein
MKLTKLLISVLIILFFVTNGFSKNTINSDSKYSIKIAVTINQNDHIMGKLEYSNEPSLYPLQLVTFTPIAGTVQTEPYVFKLLEKHIVSENIHKIICQPLNDKYGTTILNGTIDFTNETKPKILLVNTSGNTYMKNLTDKGRKIHKQYIPDVWLGN